MRRIAPAILIVAVAVGHGVRAGAAAAADAPCLMQPSHTAIVLRPAEDGDVASDTPDVCAAANLPSAWQRGPAGALDLYIALDGPSGSGRFWTITLGAGPRGGAAPDAFACIGTSTVGWRTLRSFKDAPLPWVADLDDDARAEVILWESFPLREEASLAELGLVAWVYRATPDRTLTLDMALTRAFASELAAEYRSTPADGEPAAAPKALPALSAHELAQRQGAARALERLAAGACTVAPP
jgi:hypothetical protein